MSDDPRIVALLEQILDSGSTPEEVCSGCPELLPALRARWKHLQAVEAQVEALFPFGPASGNRARRRVASGDSLPAIPGYQMLGILGQGGMGVVYGARHLRLDRPVAIK